jgi:crotonobetainyl-CoA:carnitine CoA-transferase CaiB-like acyl-CoA transferase
MLRDSLDGLRVLDFSHVVAGPVCGMLLGDMGADVVKIEAPGGELGRSIGPPWQNGQSVAVLSVNRNKRGLAIDLKNERGLEIARALVAKADVIVESFRPGVMKRMGLAYEQVECLNPRIVYCSVSAYGQDGPNRERPGVDGIIQAVAGLMSTLGETTSGPCKVPVPIADMATGYLATIGVLSALHRRHRTGQGQYLDVSLYNAALMLQQIGLAFYLATEQEPQKCGSAAPYAAPNEAFPTEDGWVMVAAYQPERWKRLCELLEMPHLAGDERFASNSARVENRSILTEILSGAFKRRTTHDWIALLEQADILCAPIASYREVTQSLQYRHAGVEIATEHPHAGLVRMPGFAIGGRDETPHRPAPLVGEHSRAVLREMGLSPSDIEALANDGVIHDPAVPLTPTQDQA